MASKKVNRIGLQESLVDHLLKNNITTCQDLLCKNSVELLSILGVSLRQVEEVVLKTSEACAPESQTALQLKKRFTQDQPGYIATTLESIDTALHGGLQVGTITEIAGPSGCGKTQFCMMLTVQAMLPSRSGGLNGAVAYIDTESAFSATRLVQIARSKYPNHFTSDKEFLRLVNNVYVYQQTTCTSLLNRLETFEYEVITKGIKLIILDSVASLVRKEFDIRLQGNFLKRTNLLAKEAAILKNLAENLSIPVIVTNQITTRQGSTNQSSNQEQTRPFDSGEGQVTAALGNTWSHSVNTRLLLQYHDAVIRQVLIAKSPVAPFTSVKYTILDKGIVAEPTDQETYYQGTDPGLQSLKVRSSLAYEISHQL
ncbi:DNA repair protein RAD51 homolog 2-like [Antedon mediterranea]|uniref:DNA repair protein RAD51 homolog 2-like n=1 Tax=Antedon mediterranea TaxID=105859 RepID=UPI003AF45C54